MFEEEEGIWRALLLQLKKDPKASVDAALKVCRSRGGVLFVGGGGSGCMRGGVGRGWT